MNLHEAFTRLAPELGVDVQALDAYASEDTVGGYHKDPDLSRWPMGSIYEVEGQFLYALVRILKPAVVVEIGVYSGCSTTHILTALQANGSGVLRSYDFEYPGWMVPPDLKSRWQFSRANAFDALVAEPVKAALVFEDAFHDARTGALVRLLQDVCQPKVMVSHDAEHYLVGAKVRFGWDEVYGAGAYDHALIPPSDCGLAWKVHQNGRRA